MTDAEQVTQRSEGEDPVDPLLRAIGRQIKFLRERAGLTQVVFGERIGYGVDLVSSVERGRRAPKEQFIDGAERVLDAGGLLDAVRDDIERARLPARFRDWARMEKDAVSMYAYEPLTIPGLLQTEGYARALVGGRCPPLSEETVEEAVLRRPVGGHTIMREQLHRLLDRSRIRNVSLQIMPTERWQHNGSLGPITLLETEDGRVVAHTESQGVSSIITDRTTVRVYGQRHGIIRMQALDTEESARLIEQLAGEL